MSDLEHARLFMKKANADLKALGGMLNPDTFEDEIFGFHAQQAAEKGLKALLCQNDIVFPKIHDIDELVGLLESKGSSLSEKFAWLSDLTNFAVQFRYESYEDVQHGLDRQGMITGLMEFMAYVENKLETV